MIQLDDLQIEICRLEIEKRLRATLGWDGLIITVELKDNRIYWCCPNAEAMTNHFPEEYNWDWAAETFDRIIKETVQEITGYHNG